jgi:hypothetical protein
MGSRPAGSAVTRPATSADDHIPAPQFIVGAAMTARKTSPNSQHKKTPVLIILEITNLRLF